jgi:zinc protease
MMKIRSKLAAAIAMAPLLCSAAFAADVTGHHRLSNGVDVRLFPSDGTSLVATLVLVKTGYALEEPANLGYSHLLEHLVFAGTEEMDKESLFDEVERLGGYLNGYTRDDYMGYLMVGHRENYRRQLELLADILFRAAVKEEAVGEAREVVLEEIRRRQSRPGTRVDEMFQALLYEGSTYARTGLGSERTVASVSREELLNHYRRFYRPDNMILLTAGGIETGEVLSLLEETFGAADPGASRERPPPPPPLRGRRRYTLRSELPGVRVQVGFNGPDPRKSDTEALDLLAAVLGGGGGRIEKALEAAGLSPRGVSADLLVNDGFSRFVISSGFPAGTAGEEVLQVIEDEVALVAGEGPSEEEVTDARDALRAGELMGREKLHYYLMGKASWVMAGAPGQGFSGERWDGLDGEDMKGVAGRYLAGKPFAALFSLPAGKGAVDKGGAAVSREKMVLDNGLVVIAEKRPASDVFALNLMTRRRSSMEPAGKAGIADFLHRMLPRGTSSRSRGDIEEALRKTGASLTTAGNPTVPFGDFYTSRSYSFVRAECIDEEAEKIVELVADMVNSAAFPQEEIEKVRSQMTDFIAFRDGKPSSLAGRLLAENLYGPGPLGSDVLGEESSILSVSQEDLAAFREEYFTGKNLVVSVVSGRDPEESLRLVTAYFAGRPPGETTAPAIDRSAGSSTVERELGKAQGALAAGAVLGEAERSEGPALAVVTGLLNDRLNRELREREGLAYSVGSSLGIVEGTAVFSFSMGTSPEKMEQARKGVRREIEAVRGMDVTTEELERRVNAITGRLQMRTLSSLNRGFYLALSEQRGLDHTYDEDYRRILLRLTPEEVEAAAGRYLPRELIEVIVR